MTVLGLNTWNPVFHAEVVNGVIPSEELQARTLAFTLIDRDRAFDTIEWSLDNRDGMLTDPKYLAAGLVVRIKLGYIDSHIPWRNFIINRVRGGVGVKGTGATSAPMGSSEGTVSFEGRNRNAAGGKRGKQWSNTARPPPKKPKVYGATMSGQDDLILGATQHPKIVEARTLSEAIRKIAERNGFASAYQIVEETNENLGGGHIAIASNLSDGQYLSEMAASRGYLFKIDGDFFRWHSKTWSGAKSPIVAVLDKGRSPDTLEVTIDADFRLPIPRTIKVRGYDYRTRAFLIRDDANTQANLKENQVIGFSRGLSQFFGDPARTEALSRDIVVPTAISSSGTVTRKAEETFISRHLQAFQINVKTVGDPILLASRLVEVKGTGSPFVDGVWYIREARHDVRTGQVYVTQLHLSHPPKMAKGQGKITVGLIHDPANTAANQKASLSMGFHRGSAVAIGTILRAGKR